MVRTTFRGKQVTGRITLKTPKGNYLVQVGNAKIVRRREELIPMDDVGRYKMGESEDDQGPQPIRVWSNGRTPVFETVKCRFESCRPNWSVV